MSGSGYDNVKRTKLVLKGDKPNKRKKKHQNPDKHKKLDPEVDVDVTTHGGWCKVKFVKDITGSVCIEFGNGTYVKALDNGCFTLGPPHDEGEGPSPEEIVTAVVINDSKVAFKSGYGKYLSYNKDGCVVGKSDAIGPLEQWEPLFQEGKLAVLGSNNCFMSIRESDDTLIAASRTASENEILNIRYMASVNNYDPLQDVPLEERGNLSQIEMNYVKKFQKFQDKKVKINTGERSELFQARHSGTLHETLLDRRSKMKSDRYCK